MIDKTKHTQKEITERIKLLKKTRKVYRNELCEYNNSIRINQYLDKKELENKLHALDVEIKALKKLKKPKRKDKPFSSINPNELTEILRKIFGNEISQIAIYPNNDTTFMAKITRPIHFTDDNGETVEHIDNEQLTLTATELYFSADNMDKYYIRQYQTELNKRGYFADDLFEKTDLKNRRK